MKIAFSEVPHLFACETAKLRDALASKLLQWQDALLASNLLAVTTVAMVACSTIGDQ